ncbi:OmpA family protein [Flammeovirga sp. MY04]|uniref:OmpA family protein n=1 Tax=Flammeovirga sp. MY04 TaxID=1191459 RepID=UPI0008061C8A|nr:OmpA family protein [Flammeovirga sp. MY04]ANQ48724.1 OmpA family protein [Flammeovirga sp. MY04]
MKYLLIVISLLITVSNFTSAQNSSKANKFFVKAEEAIRLRQLEDGKALLYKSIDADITYGDSYYLLSYLYILEKDYQKSRDLYEKLMECCADNPKYLLAHLSLAQFEWSKGNYKSALGYANDFLNFKPDRKLYREVKTAHRIIASCDYAIANIGNKLPYEPINLGAEVNVHDQQYFPAITANGQEMYFTARDEKTDENIYRIQKVDGEWASPEEVTELNTKFNEGTCSISADGSFIIFTSCESTRELPGYGSCDLFMARKVGDQWLKPRNLGPNINSRDWESQPSLSADGRVLYFVSDRQGGMGKKDIWVSELGPNGQWMPAKNLGDQINTTEDDISPFIHANGKTLYFSSKGHLGYGGLDIFKSEKEGINRWSKVENIGYPVNDHTDQVALIVGADGTKGYFSKEEIQEDGSRNSHLVSIDIPKDAQPLTVSGYLEGVVYDAITKKPLKAELELKLLETKKTESTLLSDEKSGKYLIVLNQNEEYALYVSRPGYLFQSLTFDTHDMGTEGKTMDIFLDRIEKGKNVTLNNIFFDSNKYDLKLKSQTELDKVLLFMQKNKDINVEIGGHTDNIGNDNYNLDLSQKRAEAVVQYLIDKGIDSNRLTAKGYGEKKPIDNNTTDEGRTNNRRIEFLIL